MLDLKKHKKENIFWVFGISLVTFLYLIVKMYALHAYAGDEHIYLYQAKLISQGMIPYKDFAMAHPPLQALFTSVIFKFFGYNFILYRLLPVLWYLVGGLVLALIVYREIGLSASITAMAFSLFSYEPLRASSHYTGINMTIVLLLVAFLAFRSGSTKTCAGFCLAAIFTRLYSIPVVAALIIWAFISNYREKVKLVIWILGAGAVLFIILGIWTGFKDLVQNVFRYHIYKNPMTADSISGMKGTMLFHNAIPILFFILSLPLLTTQMSLSLKTQGNIKNTSKNVFDKLKETNLELPLLSTLIVAIFLLVLLPLNRVWMYYFIPLFPFAGITVGWAVSKVIYYFKTIIKAKQAVSKTGIRRSDIILTTAILVIFIAGFLLSPKLESNLSYYKKYIGKPVPEKTFYYSWQPSILPDFIDKAIKLLFWHDERVIGKSYCSLTYLLWHESRLFDSVYDMVDEIHKRTSQNEKIFGDSGSVPLLALLSDRQIAANEIDTNIQRYISGSSNSDDLIKRIDNDLTKLVILRNNFGVAALNGIKQLIERKYTLINQFKTGQNQVYLIYERKIGVN